MIHVGREAWPVPRGHLPSNRAPFLGIIDYGSGNLRSVAKAFEIVGAKVRVSASPRALAGAAGLVLPGVGAFGDSMRALRRSGMDHLLRQVQADGIPLLGVCLGLQIFCEDASEFGLHKGLGFFPAKVRRFGAGMKVPHMGWNTVKTDPACPLFKGLPQDTAFYFVHSFRARSRSKAVRAGRTVHGGETLDSDLWRDNIYATQIHPEKSQQAGLRLYKNFWGLCSKPGV